ncbi:MAG TPA: type II toxin-antitoxin system antitoxin SocA domain-containing protein [Jatrophihabitans sp.]|nr:type II toxin-antitoxin system antitoxin SocA domain-containing protein [Jatrophihabitans sp.]
MATVLDVAEYILRQHGPMTATKLQKLCYYSQAWHLVWEERPLFADRIEAWANGPVSPKLYQRHRLEYMVDHVDGGNPDALDPAEAESVDVVLQFYGDRSGAELSELTHREAPWRDARGDTPPGARSTATITPAAMVEYYEGLLGTSADG